MPNSKNPYQEKLRWSKKGEGGSHFLFTICKKKISSCYASPYVLEMVVSVFDSFDPQTEERCGAAQTQEAVQKKSGGIKSSESVMFA